MSATQVQFRRGNAAQTAAFTGAVGEVTVNTDTHKLHVHDGTTPGGWPFGANQQAYFYLESAVLVNQYVGGRYRWVGVAGLLTADVVVGGAPVGASVTFALEVNGALTGDTMTVLASQNTATVNLNDRAVPSGEYVRWLCTAAPSPENSATQISITMNAIL